MFMVTVNDKVVRVWKEAVVAVIGLEERSTRNLTEESGTPVRVTGIRIRN
jgi:hypothetical protein